MTIVEFLRARHDEREARWRALLVEAQRVTLALQEPRLLGRVIPGWHTWPEVEALASEALADVEAKRRIVDRAELVLNAAEGDLDPASLSSGKWLAIPAARQEQRLVLRMLALPYADHPAYDPSWRLAE